MDSLSIEVSLGAAVAALVVGAVIGGLVVALRARKDAAAVLTANAVLEQRVTAAEGIARKRGAEIQRLENEARDMRAEAVADKTDLAGVKTAREKEREALEDKLAAVQQAEQKLTQAFNALAGEALKSNNQAFLELAQATFATFHEIAKGDLAQRTEAIAGMVAPVREALGKFEEKVGALEKAREGAYAGLVEQVRLLHDGQTRLTSETANLGKALRAPQVRGRWGEMQLRRVVELAGMVEHCDFVEQEHIADPDGAQRPDMIVRLPGSRTIVVDAKVPLLAYLDAIEAADDGVRRAKLAEHARQVRQHVKALANKAYWSRLPGTPEFVVMFVPDPFLSAAAQEDPELFDQALQDKVVLATPSTLIALLKTVAYDWRQERIAKNAEEISRSGRELYERLATLAKYWSNVGKGLTSAVGAYNEAVGSLESRVLPAGRKFRDLQVVSSDAEIPTLEPVDVQVRQLQAPELTGPPAPDPTES